MRRFGDITATSEAAHLIVTAQVLLDLVVQTAIMASGITRKMTLTT